MTTARTTLGPDRAGSEHPSSPSAGPTTTKGTEQRARDDDH